MLELKCVVVKTSPRCRRLFIITFNDKFARNCFILLSVNGNKFKIFRSVDVCIFGVCIFDCKKMPVTWLKNGINAFHWRPICSRFDTIQLVNNHLSRLLGNTQFRFIRALSVQHTKPSKPFVSRNYVICFNRRPRIGLKRAKEGESGESNDGQQP